MDGKMFRLDLGEADDSAMIEILGAADGDAADELADAIAVLDAEAVLALSFLRCERLDRRCTDVVLRYDAKRNGRLIVIVEEHSQPHRILLMTGKTLQMVFSVEEAAIRSETLNEMAHRLYSNDA